MAVDVVNYIYAAIVAAGGIFGYVKARNYLFNINLISLSSFLISRKTCFLNLESIPSLIAGLVFGVVIGNL